MKNSIENERTTWKIDLIDGNLGYIKIHWEESSTRSLLTVKWARAPFQLAVWSWVRCFTSSSIYFPPAINSNKSISNRRFTEDLVCANFYSSAFAWINHFSESHKTDASPFCRRGYWVIYWVIIYWKLIKLKCKFNYLILPSIFLFSFRFIYFCVHWCFTCMCVCVRVANPLELEL